jgi:hypothetical protein
MSLSFIIMKAFYFYRYILVLMLTHQSFFVRHKISTFIVIKYSRFKLHQIKIFGTKNSFGSIALSTVKMYVLYSVHCKKFARTLSEQLNFAECRYSIILNRKKNRNIELLVCTFNHLLLNSTSFFEQCTP